MNTEQREERLCGNGFSLLFCKTKERGGIMSDRKWRWGDRIDGRLLRSLSPMTKIMPYIMPQRCDACNSFRGVVDVGTVEKYVRESAPRARRTSR